MFSAKLIAATIALFTFVSASPALQARSCTPNFQGATLTIFKTELGSPFQWQPTVAVGSHITLSSTSKPGEFLVANSGQPDGSFVFKLTADTARSLQLQGFANGGLTFEDIQFTGTTQNFLIKCSSCGGSADNANDCTVTHVQSGLCVTDNGGGSTLALTTCAGTFNQEYNFRSP